MQFQISELFSSFLLNFMAFFALMNPFANTAIFLSFTENDDKETKKLLAKKSMFTAFMVMLVFTLIGKHIFGIFGISISAFRIAGGILVTSIGFNMLHGEKSAINTPNSSDKESALQAKLSIAVSPLAVPLFAGPGTITTAMNGVLTGGIETIIIILTSFGSLCLITYVMFLYGHKMLFFIGKNGINVITRLMGLMLSVMGVEIFLTGLKSVVIMLKGV